MHYIECQYLGEFPAMRAIVCKKHVVKHKLNHVLTLYKYLSLQHSSAH
jgi:hypothetical protein